MVRSQHAALLLPTEQLEESLTDRLTGRESDWVAGVRGQLEQLETLLRRHITLADQPDGIFSEVDQTRTSLDRHIRHLQEEHPKLLSQLRGLRGEAQRAAEALRASCRAVDLGALRQHAEEFIQALREHTRQESEIVLESVTTDIGTGD